MKIKKIKKFVLFSLFAFSLLLLCVSGISEVEAEDPVYEVGTAEQLLYYAEMGGDAQTYDGCIIRLTADINISDLPPEDQGKIIRFGDSEDAPFKGTFDGNGYTITGLKNEKSVLPDHDLGLFGWTDGAVIKDLTLRDPVVDCAYRGGILVGNAKNTTIENIRIHGGKLKIQPANNVVSLITNVGFSGGAVAGSIDNTTLYNCEVRGTEVVNNSTQGVAALGGEGLYMGGIVGSADNNSVIEYCRMDDGVQVDADGNLQMVESTVRNEYDVAVGALGGKAVYAGGIAGQIKGGSSIIDSYSTADVYVYCATYVSVGAGNVGYAGGVVAEVYGSSCTVERCHYAGNIHSKQYNAILVIPIIQYDTYISGVAQYSESAGITNSYFQRSASSTSKDFRAINDNADTDTCRSLTDDQYADRDFWESRGYDLTGTIERTDGVTADTHYNKWVMDYKRGIPIHGNSVSAAIDFPGAGSVTIDGTELIKNSMEGYPADADCSVTTEDAYNFAVQGFDTYENQIGISTEARTVTDQTGAEHTNAYKFAGWYLKRDNRDDSVALIKSGYEDLTDNYNDGNKVGTDNNYTAGGDADYPLENNDLYVAHYQANVIFHDVDGNEISNEYYNYQDVLPEIKTDAPEGCTFYGWTDVPDEDGKGYQGITNDVLTRLISGGNVYQTGELVEKPLKLYPIFTDYKSNIITIMEGHGDQNKYMRDYVGTTSVKADDNTGELYIEVTGLDENNAAMYDADGNPILPDGYRFLGWYDENGRRVSQDMRYVLDGVDLTVEHTYTARLEYRVEYWLNVSGTENNLPGKDGDWYRYGELWQEYGSDFQDIAVDFSYEEYVEWWADAKSGGTYCNSDTKITDRLSVYGQNADHGHNVDYEIILMSDFPEAGIFTQEGIAYLPGNYYVTASPKDDGYNFKGWGTVINEDQSPGWDTNNRINVYETGSDRHYLEAHYTADVTFHWTDNENEQSRLTERGYQQIVLSEQNLTGDYKAPISGQDLTGSGVSWNREASPSTDEVTRPGYYFLGWIDKSSLTQDEINYIFNVDAYTTSNASRAVSYLLDAEDTVERPMDVYAVYAREDIKTTTNIKEAGVPENSGINIPTDPVYQLTESEEDGSVRLTLEADIDTPVKNEDPETLYVLKYVECIANPDTPSETIHRLTPDTAGGNVFTLENFDLGPSYLFIAYYEPLTVVYHLEDPVIEEGEVKEANVHVEIRNTGQLLGAAPAPEYSETEIGDGMYTFVGWTTEVPADSSHCYYLMSGRDEDIYIASAGDVVEHSMELYPAYAKAAVTVQSNIDGSLVDQDTVRYLERNSETGQFELHAVQRVTGTDDINYVFTGWKVTIPGEKEKDLSSENIAAVPELTDGAVYTAYFEAGHTVTYYSWDEGSSSYKELYKVGITGNDRTFIQTVENERPDGTTEEIRVPYDTEAFTGILSTLGTGQYFDEWQWVKEDGTSVSWEEFKDESITQNMELYPVIWQVQVKDSQNNEMAQSGTDTEVYVQADLSSDEPGHEPKVSVYFAGVYSEEKLTVNVSRQSKETGGVFEGVADIPVEVYNEYLLEEGEPDPDNPEEPVEPVLKGEYLADGETDADGNAVFIFDGKLTIQKNMESGTASNESFIFIISRLNEAGEVTETSEVTVNAGESVTVYLPFGTYTVEEDANWAWRYATTFTTDTHNPSETQEDPGTAGGAGSALGKSMVYINSYSSNVTCTNTCDNNKWFDFGTKNTRNIFRSDEQSE